MSTAHQCIYKLHLLSGITNSADRKEASAMTQTLNETLHWLSNGPFPNCTWITKLKAVSATSNVNSISPLQTAFDTAVWVWEKSLIWLKSLMICQKNMQSLQKKGNLFSHSIHCCSVLVTFFLEEKKSWFHFWYSPTKHDCSAFFAQVLKDIFPTCA